ncbi:MAG: UvrD-helicase domain-containing protein [Ignavibacteria bacterium]|nr:UvrD-helicase domain-containing protein [Ignavibacteria bacterium]MDH7527255.1 ATP-dependent helicase [Ignavibacteria bacterium]
MDNQINLSQEQINIVHLTKGKHLVLAPPGTGKTELLSHRILFAIENGINPEEMVCLTFTNRAAKAMKERVERYSPDCKVFIGNIHRFCLNFLNKNKLIPKATILLDEEDSSLLIKEILEENNVRLHSEFFNVSIDDILRLNSFLKQTKFGFPQNLVLKPKDILFYNSGNQLLKKICLDYERIKEENNFLDFDDLLTLTYFHLTKDIRIKFQKYSWIQVDEIQDLNALHFEIIRLISAPDCHLVYFGDPEQSIFSFLGADLNNIENIKKNFQIHTLSLNYRSPSYLLKVYNDFANNYLNPQWKQEPVSFQSQSKPSGTLKIFKVADPSLQNKAISELINDLIKEEKSQTAILVRTNNSVKNFSRLLNQQSIDHFKVSHFDLFRTAVIKDVMAFLNCLIDDYSRLNWARILKHFGKINTFKAARNFVNKLYNSGLYPTDFLKENFFELELKLFNDILNNNKIILFDTETTGTNPEVDDIIQIAAIEIEKGQIKREFNRYLKTNKDLSKSIKIHGITNDYLNQNGEDPKKVLAEFLDFINDAAILAHNLPFDLRMLIENCRRNGIAINENKFTASFDTITITRRIFPTLKSYSLASLIEEFNLKAQNTHNAYNDVIATFELIKYLSTHLKDKIQVQEEIYTDNQKILRNFINGFYPLWSKVKSYFNNSKNIVDVISEFLSYLVTNYKYDIKDEDKVNLNKLFRHLSFTCQEKTLEKNLRKYVPLYETLKEPDLVIGDEKVVISTIHRVKGLEFTNVIIPECNRDVFRYQNSNNSNEDARILYVAMTRAKKRLFFIAKNNSMSPLLEKIKSHFEIKEIYF